MATIKKWVVGYFRYLKNRTLEAFSYGLLLTKNTAICFLIMPPIAYLVGLVMGWCGINSVGGGGALSDIFEPGTPWFVFLTTMLVVGIVEEAYFRLMVMDCLFMRWLKMPYWLALILSSASFGMAHIANGPWQVTLPQVVGAAACGLWFARVYRKNGLTTAMLTHGLYNFVVCMIAGV